MDAHPDPGMTPMAPHHHHPPMRMAGFPLWKDLMSSILSEKQRETIKEIESGAMKDAIKKQADIQVAGIELKDILDKNTVDMSAVQARLREIALLDAGLRFSRIKAMEDVKAA